MPEKYNGSNLLISQLTKVVLFDALEEALRPFIRELINTRKYIEDKYHS